MNRILLFLSLFFLMAVTSFGYGGKSGHKMVHNDFCEVMEHINIDYKGRTLVLESRDYGKPVVEITKEYELFINGERIKLDENQKKLVAEFYDKMAELVDRAKIIGLEGARIGADGVKLGLGTISSLFKLLSPDYDTDDLEREVEAKAKKIEKQAEKLEKEAEKLEVLAEDLESIYDEMEMEIEELDDLTWY